jgi:hypothetical protein
MAKRTREQLVAAISREIRLSQVRTDAFDDAVSQALGLNRSDHRAVDVLEQDGPMTATRGGAATSATAGASSSR